MVAIVLILEKNLEFTHGFLAWNLSYLAQGKIPGPGNAPEEAVTSAMSYRHQVLRGRVV